MLVAESPDGEFEVIHQYAYEMQANDILELRYDEAEFFRRLM